MDSTSEFYKIHWHRRKTSYSETVYKDLESLCSRVFCTARCSIVTEILQKPINRLNGSAPDRCLLCAGKA